MQKLNLDLSKRELYRAIAELAYVIAKTDGQLSTKEYDTFLQIIHQDLGLYDWLAESRFNILEDELHFKIDEVYNHAFFLIKQNKEALDDKIKSIFEEVLYKVAEIAGITQEESVVLNRYKQDMANL